MNYEKLSFDACMHAAQNDRLPLRTVVQVTYIRTLYSKNFIPSISPVGYEESVLYQISSSMSQFLKSHCTKLQIHHSKVNRKYHAILQLQGPILKLD